MLEVSDQVLRERLHAALGVARWVDEVAAAAPFESADALVADGDQAAAALTDAELDEAVAHHPRIGERPAGDGTAQAMSASEQAGLGVGDAQIDAALARGNADYEARFGRVFLIRAAGRSRPEILGELRRRLEQSDEAETAEAKEQLRQIAVLRLRTLFASPREEEPA